MVKPTVPLLATLTFGQSLTNDDFLNLKSALRTYVASDVEKIPPLVRMSFHDLVNFDPFKNEGGPHGCLAEKPISEFKENAGVSDSVMDLKKFVTEKFPKKPFTFGDVISLAGKVAVETAFPCMQIKWSFGRSSCKNTTESESGATGGVDTIAKFQPFLNRYGLTAREMAILTAGSHGLAGAAAEVANSGFGDHDFGDVNSGRLWIDTSLKTEWKPQTLPNGNLQYTANVNGATIMRLPSDLVFFPSVVQKAGKGIVDTSANGVEQELKEFAKKNRSNFDAEFAKVYAKMLLIGTQHEKLTEFKEPASHDSCASDTEPTKTDVATTTSSATVTKGSYVTVPIPGGGYTNIPMAYTSIELPSKQYTVVPVSYTALPDTKGGYNVVPVACTIVPDAKGGYNVVPVSYGESVATPVATAPAGNYGVVSGTVDAFVGKVLGYLFVVYTVFMV
ncbi:heme peroxidase [Globomyces pollinis-pini]|nr:heme peroxidase [Globomyces pollinis-pini]